jgi:DNA processing protein
MLIPTDFAVPSRMPLLHYLQLAFTEGLGPILIERLVEALGSAQNAVAASLADLQSIEGIGTAKSQKIHRSLRAAQPLAEAELAKAQQLGVQIISPDDALYPLLLRSIPDPPAVLYVKGTLEPRDLNSFALVGSRKCSFYGREQAERFAALVAGVGFTVISGGKPQYQRGFLSRLGQVARPEQSPPHAAQSYHHQTQ